MVDAARIAAWFGCSPLEVLRADDIEWQVWLALARRADVDARAREVK